MADYQVAIALFADIVRGAFPYALVFALGAKVVNVFLGMAFDGKVRL